MMEVKVSTAVETYDELKELVKVIEGIEKEYNISCTLEVGLG